MNLIQQGCIDIWIDEIVPCLKDTESGELKQTVVFKVESRSYLKEFKASEGWHINWNEIPKDVEVYALALKDDLNKVQGLIAIKNDRSAHAAYLHWACTAPWNNKHEFGKQKYEGVGGHLFAIGADKSTEWGYEGAMHGFAANKELLDHYITTFGGEYLGMLHQYQFFIDEKSARKLMEVYSYEWN
ncbi:hypothetical protein [Ruminococcus sp. HUN007]|uniref:hypothetical protein n=1 Tax=Ruminococcus sp. HUN007 TaxID=1514668 RepID=UPI0005D1D954|nr:hypothetical protein [Ruminococcus sp. HUN007]